MLGFFYFRNRNELQVVTVVEEIGGYNYNLESNATRIFKKYYKELEYSYIRYLYATFIKQATSFDKEEYNKAVNKAIENVKDKFPKYRKNKYFYKSIKGLYLLMFNKTVANLLYNHLNNKK